MSPFGDRLVDAPRLTLALLAVLALVAFFSFAVILWRMVETVRQVKTNSELIEDAEYRTCRRVQVLRDTVNHNSETIFLTLDQAARNPMVPPSIRKAYRVYTDRVVHLPRTNCKLAVTRHGYVPPRPTSMRAYLRGR